MKKIGLGDFIEDTKALAPLEQAINLILEKQQPKYYPLTREERVLRMRFASW